MALTDPELELLLEMLEEDAGDESLVAVADELCRRLRFADAHQFLRSGLSAGREEAEVRALLARTSLETGAWVDAVRYVESLGGPGRDPRLVQVWVLSLERVGQSDRALAAAKAWLEQVPDDVVVSEAAARLQAPPVDLAVRGPDPFFTARRAEGYATLDRADRAVRVYRRLLHHHPSLAAIQSRLGVLESGPHEWERDDLSEDLTDPALAPPELPQPQPMLPDRRTPVSATVSPTIRRQLAPIDDEETDPYRDHALRPPTRPR